MYYRELGDIEEKEYLPGFFGRVLQSENMTFAYWRIEAGASLPLHHHPQEQVANMLSGTFELEIDGQKRVLQKGDIACIPGNVPHAGRAITSCEILDVFNPKRQDLK